MKKVMLICAPVTSRSGYGDHARDLVWSFLKHDKYNIKILDVRWGDCPRNALDKNNSEDKKILDCILLEPKMNSQPDIYVDIRIPNEFETYGKINIGITAGVETTVVSNEWIEGCNKMDLVIVPSEHSKNGFVNTQYDKIDNNTKQKIGDLKVEKPIEVLFEGVNEDVYKPLAVKDIDDDFFDMLNEKVPEKFAYLFVGQWCAGEYGEDRKDIGRMLKVFYESFANKKKQPALIVKTNGAGFSIMDREDCINKLNLIKNMFPKDWKLPNVYLLHGNMSKEHLNLLYNHPKVKCMVSFTHGEGFGRPLLEATMTGLPVMTSNWSGHIDFLDTEDSILLGGELQKVPKSVVWKDIIVSESEWFVVDENQAYKAFNHSFENEYLIKNKAKNLMYNNRGKYTLSKMADKLDSILDNHFKDFLSTPTATEVGLKLPKLKKANKEKVPGLKLPKLKKIKTEEATV
jgi:glycosyltransferase involved in cell wall biosynthesis